MAISADSVEASRQLAQQESLTVPILADPELKAIDAYGLRHREAAIDGSDIARPAVFLLGPDGTVRWRFLTENWRVRLRPETVLAKLGQP